MTDQTTQTVKVGDCVQIVTEDHKTTQGLVTIVHGNAEGYGVKPDGQWSGPTINAVLISPDSEKTDSYGRQIERYSSLQHRAATSADGRYWFK